MLSPANAVVSLRSKMFVALVALFIVVSALVSSGATNDMDRAATEAVVRASGHPAMDMVMIIITTSSDLFPIYFSPMIVFSIIMLVKKKSRKMGAILLIVVAISAFATTQLKGIVDRERPPYEFEPNVGFDYTPESDMATRSSSSFPSGHATRSAAFALVVSFMLRGRKIAGINATMLMWAFPVAVSFSRIYIGAHYPTDVIGGILLGLIIANVMCRAFKLDKTMQNP